MIIVAVMAVLDQVVTARNGMRVILALIAPGYYCLFALSCAASLQGARALLLLLIVGVVLGCTPLELASLIRLLVPMGIGVIAGTAARAIIMEAKGHA